MKATIKKEAAGAIGLSVLDNADARHRIAVAYDGDIEAHQCDAYADKPENRTPEENEHNEQARKFAQYYVYAERGHDTVPPSRHPGRIEAVRQVVTELSDDAFEDRFGDLFRQCVSPHREYLDGPIAVPDAAADAESVWYRKRIYLGVDPTGIDLERLGWDPDARASLELTDGGILDRAVSTLRDSAVERWRSAGRELAENAREAGVDLTDATDIDAVSTVYPAYIDGSGRQQVDEPEFDPFEREADTVVELPPVDPNRLDGFRTLFEHCLRCQVRDSFVRMGLEPPEPFQVLGFGRFEAAEQYIRLGMFPDYHDPEATGAFG